MFLARACLRAVQKLVRGINKTFFRKNINMLIDTPSAITEVKHLELNQSSEG